MKKPPRKQLNRMISLIASTMSAMTGDPRSEIESRIREDIPGFLRFWDGCRKLNDAKRAMGDDPSVLVTSLPEKQVKGIVSAMEEHGIPVNVVKVHDVDPDQN